MEAITRIVDNLGIPVALGFLLVWLGRLAYGVFNHDLQVVLSTSRARRHSAADVVKLKLVLKKGKAGRLRLDRIVVKVTYTPTEDPAGRELNGFWEDAQELGGRGGTHLVPGDVVQFARAVEALSDQVVHWHVYIKASRRLLTGSFGEPTWTSSDVTLPLSPGS